MQWSLRWRKMRQRPRWDILTVAQRQLLFRHPSGDGEGQTYSTIRGCFDRTVLQQQRAAMHQPRSWLGHMCLENSKSIELNKYAPFAYVIRLVGRTRYLWNS